MWLSFSMPRVCLIFMTTGAVLHSQTTNQPGRLRFPLIGEAHSALRRFHRAAGLSSLHPPLLARPRWTDATGPCSPIFSPRVNIASSTMRSGFSNVPSGSCLAKYSDSALLTGPCFPPKAHHVNVRPDSRKMWATGAFYCEPNVWRIGINSTPMRPPTTIPQIERHRVRAE